MKNGKRRRGESVKRRDGAQEEIERKRQAVGREVDEGRVDGDGGSMLTSKSTTEETLFTRLTAVSEVCPAPWLVKSSHVGSVFSEESGALARPGLRTLGNPLHKQPLLYPHFKGGPASPLLVDWRAPHPPLCQSPGPAAYETRVPSSPADYWWASLCVLCLPPCIYLWEAVGEEEALCNYVTILSTQNECSGLETFVFSSITIYDDDVCSFQSFFLTR